MGCDSVDVNCESNYRRFNSKTACVITKRIQMSDSDRLNILNANQWRNASYITIESKSTIGRVPMEIFELLPQLKFVHLSTGIKALTNTSFLNARQLQIIDLKSNHLQIIPSQVFSQAENLVEIDLSENQIDLIESFSFERLEKLEVIYLQNNKLKVLKRFTFDGATNLKFLLLENNEIDTIESGAFDLPALKSLFMAYNKVRVLPSLLFSAAVNLYAMDFKANSLTHIGDAFSKCSKLSALILDENQIEDLSLLKFADLPALAQLSLRKSGFKFDAKEPVRSQTTSISPLTFLDLSENQLSDQKAIKNIAILFEDIEELNLQNNTFTKIDGMTELRRVLPNLNVLHLSGNNFKCNYLKEILVYFRRKKISVPKTVDTTGDVNNVHGVTCK